MFHTPCSQWTKMPFWYWSAKVLHRSSGHPLKFWLVQFWSDASQMATAASWFFSSLTLRLIMSLDELIQMRMKEPSCIMRLFRKSRSLLNKEVKSNVIRKTSASLFWDSRFFVPHFGLIQERCVSSSTGDTDFNNSIFPVSAAQRSHVALGW